MDSINYSCNNYCKSAVSRRANQAGGKLFLSADKFCIRKLHLCDHLSKLNF